MSEDRCFFQIVLPDTSVVKLKLAPDCPLLHLLQHPKLQLPSNLNGFSFAYKNHSNLDYEQTPEFYRMGTGEHHVNVINVFENNNNKNNSASMLQQQQPVPQNELSFKTTRFSNNNNNNNSNSTPLSPAMSNGNNQTPRNNVVNYNNHNNNTNNNITNPGFASPRQQELQQEQKRQMEVRHQRELDQVRQEAQNGIESLESRIRSQQQTISSLQSQNKKLIHEVQDLEEKAMLRGDRENFRAGNENFQLTRDLSELQTAVTRAEATSSSNAKYKEQFEQTEKSFKALQLDFSRLQEVCRGYRDQLEKRMSENSELRSDLDAVQRENEKLLNECALGSQYAIRLASQSENARERKEANRSLVLDMQNQQNVLAEQLAATRSALEREVNASSEYRSNLELAVRDLREVRSDAASAEAALQEEVIARRSFEAQLVREQRNFSEEKNSLLKEIEELEFSLKMSERKVTKLEEQVRVATSKVISPSRRTPNNNNNIPARDSSFSGSIVSLQQQTSNNNNNHYPLSTRKQQQQTTSSASSATSMIAPAMSASNNNLENFHNHNNNNNNTSFSTLKSGGGRSMVF